MSLSNYTIIERLAQSEVFLSYQGAYRAAVGLPLDIIAAASQRPTTDADTRCPPLVKCLAAKEGSPPCPAWVRAERGVGGKAGREVEAIACDCGMVLATVPLTCGNRLVGWLRTGYAPPADSDASAPNVGPAPPGLDTSVRGPAAARFPAALQLVALFARHLAVVGNQILVAGETCENPAITRVKEYIDQNLAEDIGLADCAHAAHMSKFYFCKVFKRSTGLAFTEYVARLRAERAKTRLSEPHLRVSEIAFAAGFQSLSQFNRVFKRVTGRCPTAYRREVPTVIARDRRVAEITGGAGARRLPVLPGEYADTGER